MGPEDQEFLRESLKRTYERTRADNADAIDTDVYDSFVEVAKTNGWTEEQIRQATGQAQ